MIKDQFGMLGKHIVKEAEEKIKKLNQQMLYQKAEIKKDFLKRIDERSKKIKNQFANSYQDFLNKSLSSTLIEAKESILNLKNRMLSDLKESLILKIKDLISDNYSNYMHYLTERIKDLVHIVDRPPKLTLILNHKDYESIQKDPSKVKSLFKNEVKITKSEDEFIGGLKIISNEGNINYNYSINAILERNIIIIEAYLSQVFSEEKNQEIQVNFEKFIENKKLKIKDYLIEYEQVQ
jgi:vacuolar-type H+-ATPase subunit E/Vma4